MSWTIKCGTTQIGTELLAALPAIERQRQPIVHAGIGHDAVVIEETRPALQWTLRARVWHEEKDVWDFEAWVLGLADLLLAGKQDVTLYEDGSLRRTYPQCALVSVPSPDYSDQTDGRFSDALEFVFVTDQRPTGG